MSLTLHFHPLASFCQKVLIGLYELGAEFEFATVNLGDEASRAAYLQLWPIGKMPVLIDSARQTMVPESSIIIEYVDRHYPGPARLLPDDPDRSRQTRLKDRVLDNYLHVQMQKIVGDRRRPDGAHDPHGVEEARLTIRTVYGMIEQDMADKAWAMGEDFTLADCAAAPPLFFLDRFEPFRDGHPNLAAYADRLAARPSVARAREGAEPFLHMVPGWAEAA